MDDALPGDGSDHAATDGSMGGKPIEGSIITGGGIYTEYERVESASTPGGSDEEWEFIRRILLWDVLLSCSSCFSSLSK